MNMKKAPNTNKLKYVGAALLEGESVTLIQAARLVLEIKEALGDEICTIYPVPGSRLPGIERH